ncbi:hypothetical protein ACWIGI_39250 [Nocardia sp. NPDC055321]
MTDPRAELYTELGGEPRAVLDALTDREAELLLRHLRQARTDQHESLFQAMDSALNVLPALLRRPARSILFGK